MNETYTINPNSIKTIQELIDKKLFLKVGVYLSGDEPSIRNPHRQVILKMSIDAILGLGTELIREALNIKEAIKRGEDAADYCHELLPTSKLGAVRELGVCIGHDSAVITI